MTGRLSFPAEWKAVPGDAGELEGYASVFGNVDQGGDIVLPGAFRKTLGDWSRSPSPMPLIADHDMSTGGVIGSVSRAAEDATGLRVTARFSSVPKAQDIRTKMIEGHLKGMSFTYETVKSYMGQAAGKSVRYLQELNIFEATVTPFPMNTLALASAKAPDAARPYGDVAYADPGYQPDRVHRYPLDTEAHCRSTWSYISQADNAAKYTSEQLAAIKGRIRAALKRYGVTVSEAASLGLGAAGVLEDLVSDPDLMIGVGGLLAEQKAQRDLAALEAWALSAPPRVRADPTEPPPVSQAELANRQAIARAGFSPPARCGVCWKCQLGGPCDVYSRTAR